MTDLRTTYAAQIAEILKAAEANVEEATANLAAQNQALEECNKRYNDLQLATNEAQRKLRATASNVRSVARDKDQKTGTAIQAQGDLNQYIKYADQKKEVSKELTNINEAVADAEAELMQTKADVAAIRRLA